MDGAAGAGTVEAERAELAVGAGSGSGGAGPRTVMPPADSAQQLFDGQKALRVDQLEQAQLEMEALLLAVVQVVEGAQDDLQIAGQLFLGEEQGGAGGAGALVGGDLQQLGLLRRPALAMRALRR